MRDDGTSDPIPILFEEPHFLLINKPAGLFSQAAPGVESVETRLALQIKQRDAHPGQPFIGLPHRLDRGTSGVMLIARNQRALARFGKQFQHRLVRKFYLAVVEGDAPAEPQTWEDYVRKIPDHARVEIVAAGVEGSRRALADATCVTRAGGLSLLRIELHTGRMHQIRVQAAARGMPVVGDAAYGGSIPFHVATGDAEESRHPPIALHAERIEFRHPRTAVPIAVTARIPDDWTSRPPEIIAAARVDG